MIGSGRAHEAAAVEVGRRLAERGCVVVTGGLDEVMAWALRGAREAGGTTIAILPGESHGAATEWADPVVVTANGYLESLAAFGMRLGRPVVVLEGGPEVEGVPRAATPAEAVELVLAAIPR